MLKNPRPLVAGAVALGVLVAGGTALAGNLRITLNGAQINAKKLKAAGEARTNVPYSDLACLALPGLRGIADSCGVQVAEDGVTLVPTKPLPEKAPIDPLLRLELDDKVIRTYPIPSTLKPSWEYAAIVDENLLSSGGKATEIGRAHV